jgi:hypothetical protein
MVERNGGHTPAKSEDHEQSLEWGPERAAALLSKVRPFWRDVYGEPRGLLGLFSGRRVGGRLGAPREIYFLWPSGSHVAAVWLADEVTRVRDVYQCAHLLTRPRRLKPFAAPLGALYVDLDHATLSHPMVPEPSLVVESSPGRLQCYWQVQEPIDPVVGEDLNRRLAYALDADRSGWDLTQLLRVPETPNRKYADALAAPLPKAELRPVNAAGELESRASNLP